MLRYSSIEQACNNFCKIATTKDQKVLLIGDSLAVGLNQYLNQHVENAGIPYKGKGVGGKTVWYWTKGEGRQWLNHQLSTFRPTHVFISLGTNDAYTRMSPKQIAELTQELNNVIIQGGASPMWIGAPTLPDKSAGVPIKRDVLSAIKSNTKFFFNSKLVDLPHSKADKIHPTLKGYSQWADEIWNWAVTGKQTPNQRPKPRSAVNGLIAMKDSEVTPALSKAAVEILNKYRNQALGTLIPFTLGGVKYVAKLSWHPPTERNPKWHKGIDLHYPADSAPTKSFSGLYHHSGIERTSAAFRQKLIRIGQELDIEPNLLAAVISFESGFNPQIVNKFSYATGLIQWMPFNIQKYYGVPPKGTHVDAKGKLTIQGKKLASEWMKSKSDLEQLDMVRNWFAKYRGRIHNVKDAYLAVFMPAMRGKSHNHVVARKGTKAYDWNSGFDRTKKGYYTVGDISATIEGRYNAARRRQAPVAQPGQQHPTGQQKPVEEVGLLEQIIKYLMS